MTDVLDLPDLLDALGYTRAERVQLCRMRPGGKFVAITEPASPEYLPAAAADADEWFGVNPVVPNFDEATGRLKGRPGDKQVTRLAAVWADLDVKAAGCPSFDVARDIIDDISALLGERPVAVTMSGHGIQPYWAVEAAPVDDANRPAMRALLRRWGRFVAHIASLRGAKVDSVFDLPRILRRPGGTNLKDPAAPIPVICFADTGAPLDVDRLAEVLDENGIPLLDEDVADVGAIVSVPADWQWGQRTCGYANTMIDGWAADSPDARHPWLLAQATRLACLHRTGCLTAEDHARAARVLAARFRALLTTGQKRAEHPGEVAGALAWGIERAAAMRDAALASELGGHLVTERAVAASSPADPFGTGLPAPAAPPVAAASLAPRLSVVPNIAPPAPSATGGATVGATGGVTGGVTVGATALQVDEAPVDRLGRLTSLTDHGNADLMVARHQNVLRYVPSRGAWLRWTGTHWHWCEDDGEAIQAAVETIHAIAIVDTETRKHRDRSLSRRSLEAVVLLARRDERLRVAADRLDADPLALNTPSGIINLETGEIAPHDPDRLCTKITRAGYDPDADMPQFRTFLADTFGDDEAIIGYLQRVVGYSATGLSLHHILPFMHGGGGNGKGVFTAVSTGAPGSYATTAPPDFLLAGGRDDESAIARLAGMRMVVASEVSQQARFNESKMKLLTGGDELTARFLYQNYFTFTPSHTLWLMANHLPRVEAGGDSFWRRLRLIPFNRTVPDDRRDEMLGERLLAEEGSAILAWIVSGAIQALANGLQDPPGVRAATAQYAEEEDALARFLEDTCVIERDSHLRTNTKRIREAYDRWCRLEDEKPVSPQAFGRELRNRFDIQSVRSNGQRFYVDLALRADDEEIPPEENGHGDEQRDGLWWDR